MALIALLFFATSTLGVLGYIFFGDVAYVVPGSSSLRAVELKSDSTMSAFGAVRFDVPAGMKFADLTTLKTDFNVTHNDCFGGSPRFQVKVDTGSGLKNIFVYIGPYPNYTGCTPNVWTDSGDLLETGKFVDTSQVGGTFYDTYDNALSNYGGLDVVSISLVADGSWGFVDGEQTVLVDNVAINDVLYDFEPTASESKDSCKGGGWMDYSGEVSLPGPFKNQGDCVSHFISEGRN
jgi:hypothetical protein